MYYKVRDLYRSQYKNYISKYGYIEDYESAKKALCLNCNAWYVISQELRDTTDLIYYFQPTGCYVEAIDRYDGVQYHICPQIEFNVCENITKYTAYQIPKFYDFDEESLNKYKLIQRKLSKKYDVIRTMNCYVEKYDIVDLYFEPYNFRNRHKTHVSTYIKYDRSNLEEIVKSVLDVPCKKNEKVKKLDINRK